MNWNEIKKKAVERGFRLAKHGGSHDLYVNDEGKKVWLERHWSQEVRPGLAKRLKKEIGF